MTNLLPVRQDTAEVWLMPIFIAKAGYEADLQEALTVLQAESRQDPGCLEYTVFSDDQRPGTFVLFEGWTCREELTAHNEESHVKEFVKEAAPLLAVPFSVSPLTRLA